MNFVCEQGELLSLAMRDPQGALFIREKGYRGRGRMMVSSTPTNPKGQVVAGLGVGGFVEDSWGGGKWADLVSRNEEYSNRLLDISGINARSNEIGGIWNGEEVTYLYEIYRFSGLLEGGRGPRVEMGVVVSPVEEVSIDPIQDLLVKTDYKGPFSLGRNIRVGVEVPVMAALLEVAKTNLVEMVEGVKHEIMRQYGMASRITLPPFPYDGNVESHSLFPDPKRDKHVWLTDAADRTVGVVDGDVGWVSARGQTMREARRRVERTIENLHIPTLQFRLDIGKA